MLILSPALYDVHPMAAAANYSLNLVVAARVSRLDRALPRFICIL
jgi:hypothetical protein